MKQIRFRIYALLAALAAVAALSAQNVSVQIDATTGALAGGAASASSFTTTTTPALTLSTGAANIRTQGNNINLYTGGSSATYTLRAPSDYYITGYTFTGQAVAGVNAVTFTPQDGGTATTFSSVEATTMTVTLTTPVQSTYIHPNNVNIQTWATLVIYYTDADGNNAASLNVDMQHGSIYTRTNNVANFGGVWRATDAPQFELQARRSVSESKQETFMHNMGANDDGIRVGLHANGAPYYTIAAPDGYLITGYSLTDQVEAPTTSGTPTFTPSGGDATTFSFSETSSASTTLATPATSTTFTVSGGSLGLSGSLLVSLAPRAFAHYIGQGVKLRRAAGLSANDYMRNGMGDVDEVHYYYYVDGSTSDYAVTGGESTGSFQVSPATGTFNNGTAASRLWTHSSGPAVTLSSGNSALMQAGEGDAFTLSSGGSTATYTLTAPTGVTSADRITGYTITGHALPVSTVTQTVSTVVSGTFPNGTETTFTHSLLTPAQSTQFSVTGNNNEFKTKIQVHYRNTTDGTTGTTEINTLNGSFTSSSGRSGTTGFWAITWSSTETAPQITLRAQANNLYGYADGYIDMRNGSNGSSSNFTLSTSSGYVITGYEIVGTVSGNTYTVTPANVVASSVSFSSDAQSSGSLTISDAKDQQISVTGGTEGLNATFEVGYRQSDGTEATITISGSTGTVTDNVWTASAAPVFTFTTISGSLVTATDGSNLLLKAGNFTISAPDGYTLTSLNITAQAAPPSSDQTLTASSGTTQTFVEGEERTLTVSLSEQAQSTTFTLAGNASGLVVTGMTVNYASGLTAEQLALYGGKHLINLDLPIQNYSSSPQNPNAEPIGYYRWFDYRTDLASERLVKYNDGANQLAHMDYADGRGDCGLVAYNLNSAPRRASVGVYYAVPSEADNKEWAGDVVACDVSRYADYNDVTDADGNPAYAPSVFTHEPTLSTRYVFHILPARLLADSVQAALTADHTRGADLTLDDKKSLTFGAKETSSVMHLRTQLRYVNSYWFYPMQNANTHHVYYPDGEAADHAIVASDFASTTPVRAAQVEWRVYSEDRRYWRQFGSGSENLQKLTINNLYNNGNDWYDLSGQRVASSLVPQITYGSTVYLVGILKNGNDRCPFFNATLLLQHTYPRTSAQITNPTRTKSYLEGHYNKIIDASFDGEFNDFRAPTDVVDNMQAYPSDFRRRQYGFVYPLLAKLNPWRDHGHSDYFRYGPQHGDYGLYKTANVKGISNTVVNETGYIFAYGGGELYDRTHEQDANRYGQFLYVDASEEARQIGSYDVANQSLCSGSQIFVSAWVASMTTNSMSNYYQPEVRFNLYGVRKDAYGYDLETKLLGGIASGDFDSNADGYNYATSQGVWYNVFGTFLLPQNSGAENYTDFRITIDNYCGGTNGADYAVDDIQVFATNAKLTVTQSPPVCPSSTDDDVPAGITYKIVGDYTTLQTLTATQGSADRTVFYRFMEADGDTYTAATNIDYDGDGTADEYGTAIVPATIDRTRLLAAANGGTAMFEDGQVATNLVLANKVFPLSRSKTYFVSLALPGTTDASQPGTWGESSSPCSAYSSDFQVVKQEIAITDSSGNRTTNVYAECGSTWATHYSVQAVLTVPARTSSGSIGLAQVPFDWYVTDNGAQTGGEGTLTQDLLNALKRFRAAYPSATNLNDDPTGDYTQADKDALSAELYNYNGSGGESGSPTGHLLLKASSVFNAAGEDSCYHMRVGSHTIYAIPTADSFTDPTDGVSYELCAEPMRFTLNVNYNGPSLTFGINGVLYPEDLEYRSVRTGLPHVRALLSKGTQTVAGRKVATLPLRLPVTGRYYSRVSAPDEVLTFVGSDGATTDADARCVYIVPADGDDGPYSTTDPTIEEATLIGAVDRESFNPADNTVNLLFVENAEQILHEGYQYVLELRFVRTDTPEGLAVDNQCAGVSTINLKIVPEYLTWSPQDNASTNWNIDEAWRRSTAAELYKADYTDYGAATYPTTAPANPVDAAVTRQQAYVPMDFSKVTIPQLSVRPYPMLPYIQYNRVGTAVEMSNENGSFASEDIEYDMQAYLSDSTDVAEGTYDCRNFRGNVCEQIYFKPGAELMRQNYLQYERAWVERELTVGEWSTFTSPLKLGVSGDLYVPKATGRQETEAFAPITFDATTYSRVRYPFYQRTWGLSGGMALTTEGTYERVAAPQVNEDGTSADAFDHPTVMLVYPDESEHSGLTGGEGTDNINAWSHVFNRPDLLAPAGTGFSIRVGDDEFLKHYPDASKSAVLLRLPKADKAYSYYRVTGGGYSATTATVAMRQNADTDPSYRLGVDYDASDGAMALIEHTPATIEPTENHYYLIGNPYMSSISATQFISQNSARLMEQKLWVLRDGVLVELPAQNTADVSGTANVIHPFEAFFVKMNAPAGLTFSNVMQTSPNVRTGSAQQAKTAPEFTSFSVKSRAVTVSIEGARGAVRVYSPQAGRVAIENRTATALVRIDVLSSDGLSIASGRCEAGSTTTLRAPRGVAIVRLVRADGTTETHKLIVS